MLDPLIPLRFHVFGLTLHTEAIAVRTIFDFEAIKKLLTRPGFTFWYSLLAGML